MRTGILSRLGRPMSQKKDVKLLSVCFFAIFIKAMKSQLVLKLTDSSLFYPTNEKDSQSSNQSFSMISSISISSNYCLLAFNRHYPFLFGQNINQMEFLAN